MHNPAAWAAMQARVATVFWLFLLLTGLVALAFCLPLYGYELDRWCRRLQVRPRRAWGRLWRRQRAHKRLRAKALLDTCRAQAALQGVALRVEPARVQGQPSEEC